MNAVGIDVSKGKSTVAVIQPFGIVIAEPFDVFHTDSDLKNLTDFIKSLSGETKVVMEYTGTYYEPIANALHNEGIFVSVVNPLLIDDYGTNRVRKVKTDKKDSLKIASFAIDKWLDLREYIPADDIRKTLKILNRQYIQYNKILVMQKNNLIALLDSCFPNVNTLFTSPRRESDGHEKWIDFVMKFPHIHSVSKLSLSAFKIKYQSWCKKNNYNYSESKAAEIHAYSRTQVSVLPMTDSVIKIITEAAALLNSTLETLRTLRDEMDRLSSTLPEYEVVMELYGVGKVLGSQLIAEIGDVRRLDSSKSLVALAGIDPPPNQSGQVDPKSRSISKRGSPALRKILFQIMAIIIQNKPVNDPVYQFLDKKRSEGKPYRVYMIAAAHKFLRIYYARVMEAVT
ncbi:MAG: IS110 family transposase [Oscillospiraceae bacterium]|nr:IS110 family transposase [Oscillospiraceae bacterium]